MLLVSYCFPPDATVGALRWQKLARFASELGWTLDVLTLDPTFMKHRDSTRLEDLPAGTRVFGVRPSRFLLDPLEHQVWLLTKRIRTALSRSRGPASAARPGAGEGGTDGRRTGRPGTVAVEDIALFPRRLRDVLRTYYAWAEHARYSAWARRAAKLGVALASRHPYRVVVTSAPPHATHDAGRRIAEASRLPLVVDLRDPWSLTRRVPEAVASPLYRWFARRGESRCLARAALVVANTPELRDALVRAHPGAEDRTIAVRNGCDDDPMPPSRHGSTFVIGFAGTVYFDRDPRALFRGAARVIRDLGLDPSRIRLEMVGAFDEHGGLPLTAIAGEEGIREFVRVGPPRPHRETLDFFAGATMLVTFPGYNSSMTIPAKTFEYVRFDAWLLALTERDSPLHRLLQETDADRVEPEDVAGIAAAIRRRYVEYRSGHRPKAVASDDRFGRKEQARVLLREIERIAAPARPAARTVRRPAESASRGGRS